MPNALHSLAQVRDLPIAAVVDDVVDALVVGNVLLHAEPGAGKSTALPLAILLDTRISGKIVMLEPRRLAARGVAERIASQLGESVGQQVGLRMRGSTHVSANTRLEVVTEGVLTRMLQSDPSLDGVDLVIFDEFHERGLHTDLGLALCMEVQTALRPSLRLLLMSATLALKSLDKHLIDATFIHCTARQHLVSIVWVGESKQPMPLQVTNTVLIALTEHAGDVLVFLPGVAEIEKTASLLTPRLETGHEIHRLHSGVSAEDQRAATAPADTSSRRIILSTSIAETSITIDGVCVVVDAGLERRGRVDSHSGASLLETVKSNQSSATQRSGRAGRTAPGRCYRLWSEEGHGRRADSWQAEIHRADLAPLLLELNLWGANAVSQLPWLEPPPQAAITRAQDLLERLSILESGQLTAHGREVGRLPLHPRLGHMLMWGAEKGAGVLACKLALVLEDGDRRRGITDLEEAIKLPLNRQQSQRLKQLQRLCPEPNVSEMIPSVAVLLAQAFPDWIARRRSDSNSGDGMSTRYALSCGAGAILRSDDSLVGNDWLAVAQLGGQSREARIFSAAGLNLIELENFAPELFIEKDVLDWDDRLESVLGEQQRLLGSLVTHSRPLTTINDAHRAQAMLSGIRRRTIHCLPWTDECREWQARVERIGKIVSEQSELISFPAVDDDSLTETLETWLLPYLTGIGSLKALAQLRLLNILTAMLDYQQQRLLDEWLPQHFTVPSGSRIKLRYSDAGNPVLSVKLQEMFGCSTNPTLAEGRIALKVELLSPARRPVQVTEDLANFWHNSYAAVKKELAGRYPKHYWPADPLEAPPTAKAKPRKKK